MTREQSPNEEKSGYYIFRDKKNPYSYECKSPILDSEFFKKVGVKDERRFEAIAVFRKECDARKYVEFISAFGQMDTAAYYELFHEVCVKYIKDDIILDPEALKNHIDSIKKESDRDCFGNCYSSERLECCHICYSQKNATWKMCAMVRSLRELSMLLAEQEGNASEN